MLRIGAPAPDFTVTLSSRKPFALSAQRGRNVILFFFPRAGTPGCNLQATAFRDAHDEIASAGAVVLGISTDGVDRLRDFEDRFDLPFLLASDAGGTVRRLYGVERRFGPGTSRVTYVVDGGGVIRGVFHHEVLIGRHVRNAVQMLEAIQQEQAVPHPHS